MYTIHRPQQVQEVRDFHNRSHPFLQNSYSVFTFCTKWSGSKRNGFDNSDKPGLVNLNCLTFCDLSPSIYKQALSCLRARFCMYHQLALEKTELAIHPITPVVFQCVLGFPERLMNWVRPMEDCAMCRGLKEVDFVSNISPKEFEER